MNFSMPQLLLWLLSFLLRTTSSCSGETQLHLHDDSHAEMARRHCEGTLYPDVCFSSLSKLPDLNSKTLPEVISRTLNQTIELLISSQSSCNRHLRKLGNLETLEGRTLLGCLDLLHCTTVQLKTAISDRLPHKSSLFHDLQTLLSGSMTNLHTCLDELAQTKKNTKKNTRTFEGALLIISHHISNSLAMLMKITRPSSGVFPDYSSTKDGSPTWLSKKDRRLLQSSVSQNIDYNLTVAKDGSGNFTTITEAIAAAPNYTTTRFVIHIKAGAYFEYVVIESYKTMLMLIGDGINKTFIKGNRNAVDGWPISKSATVAVMGNNFLARDITVENYAGPSKQQAVALRNYADMSAFYHCCFIGYQDTLYVQGNRQFYRECDVYGTVDFIFGDASVVIQNSNLYARKPNPKQKNVFTAQGRYELSRNTGITIQNCKLAAAADLLPVLSSFQSYLGRPWKKYSRTVIIQSQIDNLIDPAGWLEYDGDFGLDTLYYGEYDNRGPGSEITKRVTWPGYHVINTSVATQFTIGPFLKGDEWIPATGIPYFSNLTII